MFSKEATFVCLLLFIEAAAAQGENGRFDALGENAICEEVPLVQCRPLLRYNYTTFPNMLDLRRSQDARRDFQLVVPLLHSSCSYVVAFFVCSMYAPLCDPVEKRRIPPCRELCVASRRGCESRMNEVGFTWPFRCDELPSVHEALCVGTNDTDAIAAELKPIVQRIFPHNETAPDTNGIADSKGDPSTTARQCPEPLRVISDNETLTEYTFGGLKGCGVPCPPLPDSLPDDWYFSETERDAFAPNWIFAWSIICAAATFATILTFLIDRARFGYPERPIILLAFCYFLVSIIYVAGYGGLVKGPKHNVACNDHIGFLHQRMNVESVNCAVQFLVLYFFTIASALWWVILTLTWFLAAGLAWGTEAIDRLSQYFHLCAWVIPAILTIVVLALQKVDGDYLSGVCFVGVHDLPSHNIFVVAPLLACLLLGTFFLLAGFYSMFRIRSKVNVNLGFATKEKARLEKFMARIGIFSVMYTVPATIVVACLIYESTNRPAWETTQIACARNRLAIDCTEGARPSFVVFMAKYFMLLLVGITSGLWIWSKKTAESWKSFLFRCRCVWEARESPMMPRTARAESVTKSTMPQPRPAAAAMGSQGYLPAPVASGDPVMARMPYAQPMPPHMVVGSLNHESSLQKQMQQESDV